MNVDIGLVQIATVQTILSKYKTEATRQLVQLKHLGMVDQLD